MIDFIKTFIDFILNIDENLFLLIQDYGVWVYVFLFIIIFIETGLVVTPFLPGDSLLFAAGAFCAGVINEAGQTAELSLWIILPSLIVAAIVGDGVNYYIGKTAGLKVLKWKIRGRQIVKQKYIDKTHEFYEKHGPKTIIIARFVPIVRTFAPFVAGIGEMKYTKFLRYNVIGGLGWVIGVTLSGYFFGNLPFIKKNFELVVFGIIIISLLPMVFEFLKVKLKKK